MALAQALVSATQEESKFQFLYDVNTSAEHIMTTIVTEMYGGAGIELSGIAAAVHLL